MKHFDPSQKAEDRYIARQKDETVKDAWLVSRCLTTLLLPAVLRLALPEYGAAG